MTAAPVALVVEDERQILRFVRTALESEGFQVVEAQTLRQALVDAGTRKPDIVILDLGLPDGDGVDFIRDFRAWSAVPIVVLSARVEEGDKIAALDAGADDYLTKPFGVGELLARVRAARRRSARQDGGAEAPFRFGDVDVDLVARTVRRAGEPVHLTAKEFELLVYLSADPGAVFRRSEILHDVWDTNWYGTTKTLDAHIAAIRKKLGDPGWIESVRGVGFRFGEPGAQ